MLSPKLTISADIASAASPGSPVEKGSIGDERFDRFKLIQWWDQQKLSAAKILVVGAGALGNEIIKNLALLGVGNILVADLDRIENSNLSRSVLYRAEDNHQFKATVAADKAREIYPAMRSHFFNGNVIYDLGLGAFRWADIVIGGLDNREARLSINRACQKVNRPWIDGAIETIQGTARVFLPGEGPCYECTMSKTDWQLLQNRRSCNLLTKVEMETGKTPTTPTIGSIIAGVQCQEAIKLLHGMETIAGKGWVFSGMTVDSYLIEYQRKQDCISHETLNEIVPLDASVNDTTAGELLAEARRRLGPTARLEFSRDVLESLICPNCHTKDDLFVSLGKVSSSQAACPHCDQGSRREVKTFYRINGDEKFLDRTLARLGIPPFDIIIARNATEAIGFEFSADAATVLGPLVDGSEGLQWE
jgi:adenylyltransferase/sulfurtransferase